MSSRDVFLKQYYVNRSAYYLFHLFLNNFNGKTNRLNISNAFTYFIIVVIREFKIILT